MSGSISLRMSWKEKLSSGGSSGDSILALRRLAMSAFFAESAPEYVLTRTGCVLAEEEAFSVAGFLELTPLSLFNAARWTSVISG